MNYRISILEQEIALLNLSRNQFEVEDKKTFSEF